ncbi:hypothetical protein [Formosa algae]|uniref:hypothetical protein n=1 Tax=Formosa algae TaxID=225843 RepID=UPI000CCEC71B|nr:hypothetical protein [Formosa algae]PNW27467.1 hypothetical protein BKP44_12660 [Formosa algae]
MTVEDLVGTFTILGSNQDNSEQEYKGTLQLDVDVDKRIQAKWLINNTQEQFGSGFFKDNILVINFYYVGAEQYKLKGVVVYRVLSPDLLDGFWSEKYGDPLFLGTERGFRVTSKPTVIN